MKMLKTALASAALLAAGTVTAYAQEVYTVTVQTVPAGAAAQAAATRAPFLDAVLSQEGMSSDHNFQSFFTFPEPPENAVLVGFTAWEDAAALAAASEAVMSSPVSEAYMGSVEMQALAPLVTADGSDFDLGEYLSDPDTVVEFAIRRPLDGQEDAFLATRDAFFGEVEDLPGNLFVQEFVMPEGVTEMIGGEGDWTAVLIGWESVGAFQAALGALMQAPDSMMAFQGTIETLAYQATVPLN